MPEVKEKKKKAQETEEKADHILFFIRFWTGFQIAKLAASNCPAHFQKNLQDPRIRSTAALSPREEQTNAAT